MGLRKALVIGLILLLIPTYIVVVSALPLTVSSTCDQPKEAKPGATDAVGFCERIGFSVSRSYYGGLLRLPVYSAGMNLDVVNKVFLPAILLLAGLVWRYR